jgi:hypothetical protein
MIKNLIKYEVEIFLFGVTIGGILVFIFAILQSVFPKDYFFLKLACSSFLFELLLLIYLLESIRNRKENKNV